MCTTHAGSHLLEIITYDRLLPKWYLRSTNKFCFGRKMLTGTGTFRTIAEGTRDLHTTYVKQNIDYFSKFPCSEQRAQLPLPGRTHSHRRHQCSSTLSVLVLASHQSLSVCYHVNKWLSPTRMQPRGMIRPLAIHPTKKTAQAKWAFAL